MRYVPGDELQVIEVADGYRRAERWRFDGYAVAVHLMAEDAWYVVDAYELRDALSRTPGASWLELLEYRLGLQAAAVWPPRAAEPAIVLDDGTVRGAWIVPSRNYSGSIQAPPPAEELPAEDALPPAVEADIDDAYLHYGIGVGDGGGAEAPPPPSPDRERFFTRTPHMDAPTHLPAEGERFTVRVHTSQDERTEVEAGEDIVVEVPPDVDELELGVLLTTTPGLAVEGSYFETVRIRRDGADTPAAFTVSVGPGARTGEAALEAQFMHRGLPSGKVRREWADGVARTLGASAAGTALRLDAVEPDLTVVVSAPVDDGINYEVTVFAPGLPGFETPCKCPWALPAVAKDYIKQQFAAFVDRSQQSEARKDALVGAGLQLFDATPRPFKDAVWALLDRSTSAEPPPSILICSAEPLLPWEMMIPTRMDDAGIEESRAFPLGVDFRVGRWVRTDTKPPRQRLEVTESYLVAATNSKPVRRLDSRLEQEVLERLYRGRAITPATFASLDARFSGEGAPLLHFVCHGAAEAFDDAIFLDEDERCPSSKLRSAAGFRTLLRTHRPLVFLNACDAARTAAILGGGAGFPRVLTNLGACAVIAPLWPVAQTVAAEAAVQLYEAAAEQPDRTLADILRDVRRRAYVDDTFEDSFASYCLFGDPSLRVLVT